MSKPQWCLVACLLVGSMVAADWPMFRGDQQLRGRAVGTLPDELGLQWQFETDGPVKGSAAIVGELVFFGSGDGKVYALARDSGKERWSFATGADIEATPLVVDGTLYIGSSDNCFYALDAATGKLRWKLVFDDRILGAANVVQLPGKGTAIVFGCYDSRVYCVRASDGQILWSYETGSFVNGSPAVMDQTVVVGGCDALLHVLDAATGKPRFKQEVAAYIAGSAALDGTVAFVGNYGNEVVAVDLTEAKVRWRYQVEKFPFFSSPAVNDRLVLIGGRDKQLHALNRDSGQLAWTFRTRRRVDSSPVLAQDKVVVGGDDGSLYLINVADGQALWSYQLGRALSSPAVSDGLVVVGSEDGNLYAFSGEAGR